jgi:hypothetical protein
MQFHPDVTGDASTEPIMQLINATYDDLWPQLKDRHASTKEETAGQVYTATTSTEETPEAFRLILVALLRMRGLVIELCGRWVWITGNTREHAAQLKAIGCRWAPKKGAWYWHAADDFSFNRGKWNLDAIRAAYGSMHIVDDERQAITA